VLAHPAATLDLVAMDGARSLGRRAGSPAHLVERPREIHRRRPGGEQDLGGLVEVVAVCRSERIAVGGRDTDCRSATHHQRADGVGYLRNGSALDLDLLVGKPALVEEDDAVVFEAKNLFGVEFSGGGRRRR
jgi:hypothetical protein